MDHGALQAAAADAGASIDGMVRAWAAIDPDALALQDTTRLLTRAELVDAQERAAARLLTAGVRPGSRVGLAGPLTLETAVAALAVLRLGGVLAPLPDDQGRVGIRDALHRLRPALVVASGAARDLVAGVADSSRVLDTGRPIGGSTRATAWLPAPAADPSRPACVFPAHDGDLPTVIHTHVTLRTALFEWAMQVPALLRPRMLTAAPAGRPLGLVHGLLAPLALGGSVVLLPTWCPGAALHLIGDELVTSFAASSARFRELASAPSFRDARVGTLRAPLVVGPADGTLVRTWAARGVPLHRLRGVDASALIDPADGRVHDGILTTVSVLGDDGPCPPGVTGHLAVSGPGVPGLGVASGPAGAMVLRRGPLRTGERACIDVQGTIRPVEA